MSALSVNLYTKAGQNLNIGFVWHESLTGYRVRVRTSVLGVPLGEVDGAAAGVLHSIPVAGSVLDPESKTLIVFERVDQDGYSPSTLSTNHQYYIRVGRLANSARALPFSTPAAFESEADFNSVHEAIYRAYVDGGTISQLSYTEFLEQLAWVL